MTDVIHDGNIQCNLLKIFKNIFFKQQSPKSKLCCLFCSFKAGTDKMGTVYSVETTYGINSVISKPVTFVEYAETGQFLFLIVALLVHDVIHF
jgi:hypothetical protein